VFGLSLISTADEHLDTFELHLQKIFNLMFLLHKRLNKLAELKTAPETLASSITDLQANSALMQKIHTTWDSDVANAKKLFADIDVAEQHLYTFLGYYCNLKSDHPVPYSKDLKFQSGMKAPVEVTRVFGTLLRVRKLQQLIEELIPGFFVVGSDEPLEEEAPAPATEEGGGTEGGESSRMRGEKELPVSGGGPAPPVPSRLLHRPPNPTQPRPPGSAAAPSRLQSPPTVEPTPTFVRSSGRGSRTVNGAQGRVPRGSPLGLTNSASGRGRGGRGTQLRGGRGGAPGGTAGWEGTL